MTLTLNYPTKVNFQNPAGSFVTKITKVSRYSIQRTLLKGILSRNHDSGNDFEILKFPDRKRQCDIFLAVILDFNLFSFESKLNQPFWNSHFINGRGLGGSIRARWSAPRCWIPPPISLARWVVSPWTPLTFPPSPPSNTER